MLSRLLLLLPASRPSLRAAAGVLLLAVTLVLGLAGCDNPSCVFGGDCTGSSGGGASNGLGTTTASPPSTGDWVDTRAPTVQNMFPFGSGADPETPIVVVFSEAMQTGVTEAAFQLILVEDNAPFPTVVPLGPSALIAGGRVLILRPSVALTRGESYDLFQLADADPADLNGQLLQRQTDDLIGTFTVANTGPTSPVVVTTFPPNGATFQSEIPELVAVFSREVDAATVDSASFEVLVNGLAPTATGVPTPIVVQDLFPINDTRVFTWQGLDTQGVPSPLGRGATVQLTLSPDPGSSGNKIEDADGNQVAESVTSFDTAPFGITDSTVQSMPSDAINIENLVGPGVLDIVVSVQDVDAGDNLDVFLFGFQAPVDPMSPPTVASLSRTVPVGTSSMPGVPVDVSVSAAALDLVTSTSPLTARFLDGPVVLAFRLSRGSNFGPVTLIDVDPTTPGVQDLRLDTIPPVLVGFGTEGTNLSTISSDLQDLVVIGRATEPVGAAFVSAVGLGDNGPDPMNPPVVAGSDPFGLFVAQPVTVAQGIIPPASLPVSFTLTIYDEALNPAPVPTVATYSQLGVSGPDPLVGTSITVVAFDSSNLGVISGARVFTHADDGTTTTPLDEQLTAGDGSVVLDATLGAGEELIVTVDAAGYDLFTFHGATTERLGVPLDPTGLASGQARGTVTSATSISMTNRFAADARFPSALPRLVATAGCTQSGSTGRFECPFGPTDVRPRRVGSQSALVTGSPANEAQYSAFAFLIGFELGVPVAPAGPGATSTSVIDLPFLLNDLGLDFEELAIDVPAHTLDTSNVPGGGTPEVTLEALSPGIPGALTAGAGLAFAQAAPESWNVRAAYAGAVDPFMDGPGDALGRYVDSGTIEADLFLRVKQESGAGNVGIARPRLSVSGGSLTPPAAPALISPTAGGGSGAATYDLIFSDILSDGGSGPEGLYRARLTGSSGRGWTLYGLDPSDADATDVRIKVPDLSPMGNPLPDGTIECTLSAFAWPGLDLTRLLWTDLDREPTRIAHSITFSYSQP